MSAINGEGDRRAEGVLFLVHLLKFESDTATSKNIAIIRVNQKFTITSNCLG